MRPGQYGGVFDIGPQGIYAINVVNSEDGVITGSVDTALRILFPEYDIRDRQGYAFLERLTKEEGKCWKIHLMCLDKGMQNKKRGEYDTLSSAHYTHIIYI